MTAATKMRYQTDDGMPEAAAFSDSIAACLPDTTVTCVPHFLHRKRLPTVSVGDLYLCPQFGHSEAMIGGSSGLGSGGVPNGDLPGDLSGGLLHGWPHREHRHGLLLFAESALKLTTSCTGPGTFARPL